MLVDLGANRFRRDVWDFRGFKLYSREILVMAHSKLPYAQIVQELFRAIDLSEQVAGNACAVRKTR